MVPRVGVRVYLGVLVCAYLGPVEASLGGSGRQPPGDVPDSDADFTFDPRPAGDTFGSSVAAGVYFARLRAGEMTRTRSFVWLGE